MTRLERRFTLSSMLMRQILDKYNTQNARFPVEYLEAVLGEGNDNTDGIVFIGPRTLTIESTGEKRRGTWLWDGGAKVVLIDNIRIEHMHRDFCTITISYSDESGSIGIYEPFNRVCASTMNDASTKLLNNME